MMNQIILDMLSSYPIKRPEDQKKALLEVVQEIILFSLFRADFFSIAAFYGGSALRILHRLDRFSEDLDFSLLNTEEEFDIEKYLPSIHQHLSSFGLDMTFSKKEKKVDSAIQSAFVKGNTLWHFLHIFPDKSYSKGFSQNDVMKIKLEVDTCPPPGATYELKYILNPLPASIKTYDLPSLFSGKIHAILCRSWKTRVKGRDYYDFIWFLSKKIPVNLIHLEQRLRQNHFFPDEKTLTKESLMELLMMKFTKVDFEEAKKDVSPFISFDYDLSIWSSDFFMTITKDQLMIK